MKTCFTVQKTTCIEKKKTTKTTYVYLHGYGTMLLHISHSKTLANPNSASMSFKNTVARVDP